MKKISMAIILFSGLTLASNGKAQGQMSNNKLKNEMTVEVGGAPMYPSKTIVENAASSNEHTTLVAALEAAGLAETLKGKGPFTVFAPTNSAFEKLPAGTVDKLLKPENKTTLTSVLTYHVVPAKLDSRELMKRIEKGNGATELITVEGGKLWITQNEEGLWVKDEKNNSARITIKDVYQSNGVIHVIDTVLMPR